MIHALTPPTGPVKVHRLRLDVSQYAFLVPAPGEDRGMEDLVLDGSPRAMSWRPLHLVARPRETPLADFMKLGYGGLVVSPRAFELTRHVLERCGELLPVHLRGEEYRLLNVRPPSPCLDPEGTEWREVGGRPVHIARYAFDPAGFPPGNLFKIPELARDRIFCFEGRHPRENELPHLVRGAGLTGLVLETVWEGAPG